MAESTNSLDGLRERIDRIDAEIHDLIMARSALVKQVATAKEDAAGRLHFRPGREAQVVRRLVRRHQGDLTSAVVVRVWRELISAFIAMQGPLALAVLAPENDQALAHLARDHFGGLTPLATFGSEQGVMRAITDGRATVGILPLPEEGTRDPWWRSLASGGEGRPRVIARLPFFHGSGRAEGPEALAVSLTQPEASGEDHSYLIVETREALSRGALLRALSAVGLTGLDSLMWNDAPDRQLHLVEVEGYCADDDARIADLQGGEGVIDQVRSVGCFALPLDKAGDTLAKIPAPEVPSARASAQHAPAAGSTSGSDRS